jgi:3-isopropylmalate/(R)-2-methylmalate dehydratase large subunit
VNSVFLGSCTNGRFEDFATAAQLLLPGVKVQPHVMAKVVPATKLVFQQMLEAGLIQKYFAAGFIISNQGCGGCAAGQIGMTGHEEVQISTSNRNFRGKQGNGDTYLASPLTAVASALAGCITVPEVK